MSLGSSMQKKRKQYQIYIDKGLVYVCGDEAGLEDSFVNSEVMTETSAQQKPPIQKTKGVLISLSNVIADNRE